MWLQRCIIIIKGAVAVLNTGTTAAPNNVDQKVIFKNCVPFTSSIAE